ncbi:unnamed protein product, partial [Meganyctiphanes norvegica]
MGLGKLGAGFWAIALAGAVWASDAWITTALLATGILALAVLDHHNRGYWERLGIPTVSGSLPILGHALDILSSKEYAYESFERALQEHKNSKILGRYWFWEPIALVTEAETVKNICIKDFDHFVDRRTTAVSGGKDDYSNDFLTVAEGSHWKGIRNVLSPTFSS